MRKPTPTGLNVKETDQTKVSEWKRGWCLASDRRRIPLADVSPGQPCHHAGIRNVVEDGGGH